MYIKYFRCFGVPFGEYGCRLWGYGMVEKNIFLKFNNIYRKGLRVTTGLTLTLVALFLVCIYIFLLFHFHIKYGTSRSGVRGSSQCCCDISRTSDSRPVSR